MEQLSGLDASFLYMESANAPMHISGISIHGPKVDGTPLTFDEFRAHLSERLHLSKAYRRKLAFVPMGLDNPYWIEDPDFQLDLHLHHTALPQPGGWAELQRLASRLISQTLDRSRPLWETTFVEGLDGMPDVPKGSFALITKVHHAAIDGVSGSEMLASLLEPTPESKRVRIRRRRQLRPEPSDTELLARTYMHYAVRPLKIPTMLFKTVKAARIYGVRRALEPAQVPPAPFTAPRTRFNGVVSAQRIFGCAAIPLKRLKAIKSAVADTTLNDVVLSVCAGALRTYLLEKEELPAKSLVSMCPISVREAYQRGSAGNQVSAMLVQLLTEEPDPLRRLERIHQRTASSKEYYRAIDARTLTDATQFVPFALGGLAARLYTRTRAAKRHAPIFNVVITNVPGPNVPLYLHGAKLLRHMGSAPIFDGMGLLFAVFSYNGELTISATSCRRMIPDLDRLMDLIPVAVEELEQAIAARPEIAAAPVAREEVAVAKQVVPRKTVAKRSIGARSGANGSTKESEPMPSAAGSPEEGHVGS